MQIGQFIKEKFIFIALNIFVSTFSSFLLYMVSAKVFFVMFVPCIYFFGCIIILFWEFIQKNQYYKKLYHTFESLDKKCLLSEVIEKPNFLEGKILYDILKISNKAMNDKIAEYSLSSAEYREYIELWVHEIKTPIAGAKLICENKENHELLVALNRIEKFVEQALFYSRSSTVEQDFLIKQVELKELVNGVLRKNAKDLIENKIIIEMSNLDTTVFTDIKWTDFILKQILENSVKYKSNKIRIYGKQHENSVSLFICDNGIGIKKQDINRVFDKGFTGENGRMFPKSTGIGLYVCKKLALKLGLNIVIKSESDVGTNIEIVFPKSNMYNAL